MKKSNAVRMSALLIGASIVATSMPANAQSRRVETNSERRAAQQQRQGAQQPAAAAQPQGGVRVNDREGRALAPLQAAANAAQQAGASGDWAAAAALVPAAEGAIQSNEGRYFLNKFKYSIAVGMNNTAGQEAALTALSTNPATPAEERAQVARVLSRFPHLRAEAAFNAGNFAEAERLYREIVAANPTDEVAQGNLRVTLSRQGNTAGSLELIQQQIRTAEAGGAKASEALYRQAWDAARRGTNSAATATALDALLTAYPTPANWRIAVEGVRSRTGQDVQFLLDTYRLGKLANVIQNNEYQPLANSFGQAGLLAETKATIEAGIAAGAIQPTQTLNPFNTTGGGQPAQRIVGTINTRIQQEQAGLAAEVAEARRTSNGRQASNIADALHGYGRFAEAAELYRFALGKSGVDANLINTRLGASLAQAGQRAEAEAAFRAVTGPRAELAALWLVWLASRAG